MTTDTTRRFLTTDEAIQLVWDDGEGYGHVHHDHGGMLMGFDVSLDSIYEKIASAQYIELGGHGCMAMGHGIVIAPAGAEWHRELWFVKHDPEVMIEYETNS